MPKLPVPACSCITGKFLEGDSRCWPPVLLLVGEGVEFREEVEVMLFRYSDGLIRVFSSVSGPTAGLRNLGGTKGSAGVAPVALDPPSLISAPDGSDKFLLSLLFLTRSEGLTIVSFSSSSLDS